MDIEVQGYCNDKFSAVKEAFRKNFQDDLDTGASFAATVNGRYVVDIWAGYADAARTRLWDRDTIVNVYSTTKAMTAICMNMLVDRGLLDLDAPVARYWPEFAQAGKENIPVWYLLTHQSGVAGLDERIPTEALYDWDRIIGLLEKQEPMWEPGTAFGYHALTFGYLNGEVIRRITGKTPGTFLREEVTGPLDADFYIGLPETEDARVADLIPYEPGKPLSPPSPNSLQARIDGNPGISVENTRSRAWRGAEIPAGNGHGNARGMARVGAAIACGGELDGVRLMGLDTIKRMGTEKVSGTDLVLGVPFRYGLGFGLYPRTSPGSVTETNFGHGGAGGSMLVMDPNAGVSWSYAMNRMRMDMPDTRTGRLSEALYASL